MKAVLVSFLLAHLIDAQTSGDPNHALKGLRLVTLKVIFPDGDAVAVSGQIAERIRARGIKCKTEASKGRPILLVTVGVVVDFDGIYKTSGRMELQEAAVVRGRKMDVITWTTGERAASGPSTDKEAVPRKLADQLTDFFLSDWHLEN
jgi:hypothetical protein